MIDAVGWLLSSSVIVAFITYITNTKIKNKELIVQIKLAEQNKWINNVDESLKKFVELNLRYFKNLIDYSMRKIESDKIHKDLMELNRAQHSLYFYINQLEYNKKQIEDINEILDKIVNIMENQTSLSEEIIKRKSDENGVSEDEAKKFYNLSRENEEKIGKENINLAVSLGEVIRNEKISLADEVIENKVIKKILK
ncbi:hypothetical protein [Mammaliicoccus sciuri]|uniref:hypothetical protein n=1 Tax=Mammaliicoccus sciuri TaxID=1296 RepID=UPI0008F61A82|nr:hypothetical protein [Mammaliicoccus sciuri]CAG7914229.1 hypothetical protein SSCS72_02026 [Mammaliicoccus sciuri]SFV43882.1 Hypothetical protein SSCIU_00673 [Mammaliicoccus sciuri]